MEGTPGKKLILEMKAEGEYSFPGLANAKTPNLVPPQTLSKRTQAPLTCPLTPMGKQCPQEPGPWGLLPLQHLGVCHVAGTQRPGGRTELTQSERGF